MRPRKVEPRLALPIGALVSFTIPGYGSDRGSSGRGYVIGEPHYSEAGSHVVLSDGQYHGMPIAAAHCKVLFFGCSEARTWRDRYERLYPGFLKPEREKV